MDSHKRLPWGCSHSIRGRKKWVGRQDINAAPADISSEACLDHHFRRMPHCLHRILGTVGAQWPTDGPGNHPEGPEGALVGENHLSPLLLGPAFIFPGELQPLLTYLVGDERLQGSLPAGCS
jgi:hypothetical protein